MPIISRRSFVAGLFAAPAVIAYAKLMPVKVLAMPDTTLHRLRQEAMRGLTTVSDVTEYFVPDGRMPMLHMMRGRGFIIPPNAMVIRMYDITPEGHIVDKPLLPLDQATTGRNSSRAGMPVTTE
jgi:hypothetical protein